jgi:hypothetical protein
LKSAAHTDSVRLNTFSSLASQTSSSYPAATPCLQPARKRCAPTLPDFVRLSEITFQRHGGDGDLSDLGGLAMARSNTSTGGFNLSNLQVCQLQLADLADMADMADSTNSRQFSRPSRVGHLANSADSTAPLSERLPPLAGGPRPPGRPRQAGWPAAHRRPRTAWRSGYSCLTPTVSRDGTQCAFQQLLLNVRRSNSFSIPRNSPRNPGVESPAPPAPRNRRQRICWN